MDAVSLDSLDVSRLHAPVRLKAVALVTPPVLKP